MTPNFIGTPMGAIRDCGLEIRFENDAAKISATGLCGSDFSGTYTLAAPANPWPRMRPAVAPAQ